MVQRTRTVIEAITNWLCGFLKPDILVAIAVAVFGYMQFLAANEKDQAAQNALAIANDSKKKADEALKQAKVALEQAKTAQNNARSANERSSKATEEAQLTLNKVANYMVELDTTMGKIDQRLISFDIAISNAELAADRADSKATALQEERQEQIRIQKAVEACIARGRYAYNHKMKRCEQQPYDGGR
ncbi:hypothetical protein PRUB_a4594 [Pseudoalteromonas rubra]|uniref:Uncharacterized protein n=1 Tax=Pseudoalteromonas rubra TaxID=43658 RepID=A0A8T0C9M8_9GAMM|nr:hypothetical protein [Pseudoalteromonas rubra]KAF7787383.1 hypothetical protein PRUB_a4594 [Pseudoalteromonas rubra]